MKHILIVEDDTWLAESYQKVLARAGYSAAHAQSLQEAIVQLEQGIPDILLVDVLLDSSTVFTLLHELQSYDDTKRIPVVVCSGIEHRLLDADKLHSYGVVRVLDKQTLTPEGLLACVKEVCV